MVCVGGQFLRPGEFRVTSKTRLVTSIQFGDLSFGIAAMHGVTGQAVDLFSWLTPGKAS